MRTTFGRADTPIIHFAHPAFWFGFAPLIDGKPRRLTAGAKTPVGLVKIPEAAIKEALSERPEWWRQLLLPTLNYADVVVSIDLLIRDSERRRAATLLRLSGRRFAGPGDSDAVEVPVTQDDLAGAANLSRNSVGRCYAVWRRADWSNRLTARSSFATRMRCALLSNRVKVAWTDAPPCAPFPQKTVRRVDPPYRTSQTFGRAIESGSNMSDAFSVIQLSTVISQVTAPAFLLSAVASTVSVLITRLNRVADRYHSISDLPEDDSRAAQLKAELPDLTLRAHFMYRAIFWAVGSGICTCMLVIIMFTSALLKFQQEIGAAVLFMIAMGLFTTALIFLAREVRLSHRGSFSHRLIGAAVAGRSSLAFKKATSP